MRIYVLPCDDHFICEPVLLLELLVSHSHLCLFYLKLSLLSFEARDQTNKREFGSCNV